MTAIEFDLPEENEGDDKLLSLEQVMEKIAVLPATNNRAEVKALLGLVAIFDPMDADEAIDSLVEKSKMSKKILVAQLKAMNKAAAENVPKDTHATHAAGVLAALTKRAGGEEALGYTGVLHAFNPKTKLWEGNDYGPLLRNVIIPTYDGRQHCSGKSDYDAIYKVAYDLSEDKSFFDDAPVGLAAGGLFYSVVDGAVTKQELTAEHRQRFSCEIEPNEEASVEGWLAFLDTTFSVWHEDDDGNRTHDAVATREQIRMFQQTMGLILLGQLASYEKAMLMKGPGRNGKGVILKILMAMFPKDRISAVSPYDWSSDTCCHTMANSAINIVGEMDKSRVLPAGPYKNVTGRDPTNCRTLYSMPYYAIINCSQTFAGNYFPYTNDRTEGFWSRWLLFEAPTVIAEDKRDPNLVATLLEEMGGIIWWALEGAREVYDLGHIFLSSSHYRLLAEWQHKHTAVLAFIDDTPAVAINPKGTCSRTELYGLFKFWCGENGRKQPSATNFYDELATCGFPTSGKHGQRNPDGTDGRPKGVRGLVINAGKGNGEEPKY